LIEFILFLFLNLIFLILFSLIRYYVLLFKESERDEFSRDELIDFQKLIPKSILDLFEQNRNMIFAAGVYVLVAVLIYGYSLLGGIIGSPHYANEFGNYFFLSPILFLAIAFGYTFLLKAIYPGLEFNPPSDILGKLLSQEFAVIASAGISTVAMNFAVSGVYREISFLFIFFNLLIIFAVLIYKLAVPKIEEEIYEQDYSNGDYVSEPDWENDERMA
jgi:hypothetical protein